MLHEKIKAPDFKLKNQFGEIVSLSDFLGKKVVLYFYPKDDTPGCTRQACALWYFTKFKDLDVVVIGISKDSVESHQKFASKYNLPFIILADPNQEVITKYDVLGEKRCIVRLILELFAPHTSLMNKDISKNHAKC